MKFKIMFVSILMRSVSLMLIGLAYLMLHRSLRTWRR